MTAPNNPTTSQEESAREMTKSWENHDFVKPAEGVESFSLITTVIWRDAGKRYKIHESVIGSSEGGFWNERQSQTRDHRSTPSRVAAHRGFAPFVLT